MSHFRVRHVRHPVRSDLFVEACGLGKSKFVEACLKVGQDPNAVSTQGRLALRMAAMNGHSEIVRLLIAHGADVNRHSNRYVSNSSILTTPLEAAAGSGDLKSVEYLLDADARADLGFPLAHGAQFYDWLDSRREQETQLEQRVKIVERLLAAGADPKCVVGYGEAALKATKGEFRLVEPLIRAGAEVQAHAQDGFTVLQSVAFTFTRLSPSRIAGIRELIRAGADVNASWRYWSPLDHAAMSGDAELVGVLLDAGAKLFGFGHTEKVRELSELCAACRSGSIESVQRIMSAGASLNEASPLSGKAAIHCAAESGNVDLVKLVLASGADLLARDDEGRDALFFSAKLGRHEVVAELLKYTVSPNAGAVFGISPLRAAVAGGHRRCVELLLAAGADIAATSRSGINARQLAEMFHRNEIQDQLQLLEIHRH